MDAIVADTEDIPVGIALKLTKLFRGGRLFRLAELLEDVISDTGYGKLTIVVA